MVMDVSVALIASSSASHVHDHLPANKNRSSLVYRLLTSLTTISQPHVCIIPPSPIPSDRLLDFHDRGYLEIIGRLAANRPVTQQELHLAGLDHDCPAFNGLAAHIRLAAGGSLQAAQFVQESTTIPRVALHWDGGRHHARSEKAAGFCYINDIVLTIKHLVNEPGSHNGHVLYLDLDIHHGDGVEQAFAGFNSKVITVSIHHCYPGFYPGTGGIEKSDVMDQLDMDAPSNKPAVNLTGLRNWINVPFDGNCDDAAHVMAVSCVLCGLAEKGFYPKYIVIQCGADGVIGDPKSANWKLTEKSFVHAVAIIKALFPLSGVIILGGGGYNHANTARVWAHVTAFCVHAWRPIPYARPPIPSEIVRISTYCKLLQMLDVPDDFGLPEDIPDHFGFEEFGPPPQSIGVKCDSFTKLPVSGWKWNAMRTTIDVAVEKVMTFIQNHKMIA